MLQNQTREIAGIDATEEVVPSWYGRVRPRVVHKTGGVVEAGGLGGGLPEPAHSLGGVQEPPRCAQSNRRVRPGERGQFPAVHSFIDGEEDDAKPRIGPESVKHWTQGPGELGLNGNVVTLVRPVGVPDCRVVVP